MTKVKDWADERADAVVNSIGYREDPEAAIAAALQQVADECAEIADRVSRHSELLSKQQVTQDSSIKSMSRSVGAERVGFDIRARFPRYQYAK